MEVMQAKVLLLLMTKPVLLTNVSKAISSLVKDLDLRRMVMMIHGLLIQVNSKKMSINVENVQNLAWTRVTTLVLVYQRLV